MASIFTKIINRELPAKIFLETKDVIVIQDIRPKAAVHLLIVPKVETKNFYETPATTLALLDETAKKVARKLDVTDHFKIQVNNGFGQEVDHIHYHFLSDRGADKLIFIE